MQALRWSYKSRVYVLCRHRSRVLAVGLVVAAAWSGYRAVSAPASHSFPSFFTPGKFAYCKLHTIEVDPPYLNCWRPRDGFTVTLESTGRPLHGPLEANKGPVRSLVLARWLLPFGESWWGNSRGLQGRGRIGKGRVLYRCTSRTSGLTCRSSSGHGFWLGRVRGQRIS